jgi:hypothetical protein
MLHNEDELKANDGQQWKYCERTRWLDLYNSNDLKTRRRNYLKPRSILKVSSRIRKKRHDMISRSLRNEDDKFMIDRETEQLMNEANPIFEIRSVPDILPNKLKHTSVTVEEAVQISTNRKKEDTIQEKPKLVKSYRYKYHKNNWQDEVRYNQNEIKEEKYDPTKFNSPTIIEVYKEEVGKGVNFKVKKSPDNLELVYKKVD